MAGLAGINRKVSYYSARKTFAQHGYDIGIEIEKIEYCIGHSMKNNRPIFNYIRIMQEHADKVLEKSSINCLNSQFYYYICINAFSFHVNVIIVLP